MYNLDMVFGIKEFLFYYSVYECEIGLWELDDAK